MGYQHANRHHRMMVAAVAPAEDIDAVVADIGKGWRDRFFHAPTVKMIRGKKKPRGVGVPGAGSL